MADVAGVNGQRTEFKVVGKPNLPGKLSYSIATGMAKFGADYVFPEMLHAKFSCRNAPAHQGEYLIQLLLLLVFFHRLCFDCGVFWAEGGMS